LIRGCDWRHANEQGKRFFFEKKKQKTFIRFAASGTGYGRVRRSGRGFFASFFPKKEALP
jgi:hypothetical protein